MISGLVVTRFLQSRRFTWAIRLLRRSRTWPSPVTLVCPLPRQGSGVFPQQEKGRHSLALLVLTVLNSPRLLCIRLLSPHLISRVVPLWAAALGVGLVSRQSIFVGLVFAKWLSPLWARSNRQSSTR